MFRYTLVVLWTQDLKGDVICFYCGQKTREKEKEKKNLFCPTLPIRLITTPKTLELCSITYTSQYLVSHLFKSSYYIQ